MAAKKITKSLLDTAQKLIQEKGNTEGEIMGLAINLSRIQQSMNEKVKTLDKIQEKLVSLETKIKDKYGDIKFNINTGEIVDE
tara:strand:- start:158 stop:406 length:249 start_codon:yes stop_codon:yes gene_type:complete